MSLKDLSTAAMIGVSEQLLNPQPDRPQLRDKQLLFSAMLLLTQAHEELVNINKKEGEVRAELRDLTAELTELDLEHDQCSRGVHRVLNGTIELCTSPDKAAAYAEVRDLLHPDGLSVNQISYLEQSGNTLRVSKRVTPEVRALLAGIIIDGQGLDVALDRWLAAGQKMGVLQSRREMLGNDDDPDYISPALVLTARNGWIRAMNLFEASLMATDYSDSDKATVLATLRAAQQRAAAARNRKKQVVEGGEYVTGGEDVAGKDDFGDGYDGFTNGHAQPQVPVEEMDS